MISRELIRLIMIKHKTIHSLNCKVRQLNKPKRIQVPNNQLMWRMVNLMQRRSQKSRRPKTNNKRKKRRKKGTKSKGIPTNVCLNSEKEAMRIASAHYSLEL